MSRVLTLLVKSFTKPGVAYQVRYANKTWHCYCPSRIRPCKHEALLSLLGPKRVAELVKIEKSRAAKQFRHRKGHL